MRDTLLLFGLWLMHFQRRLVSRPTLPKMGNFDPKRVQTYSTILSLVSGSWSRNWLHGNAKISKPIQNFQSIHTYQWNNFVKEQKKNLSNASQDVSTSFQEIPSYFFIYLCLCKGYDSYSLKWEKINNIQECKLINYKPWSLYLSYSWFNSA